MADPDNHQLYPENPRVIKINGMAWNGVEGARYYHDYYEAVDRISDEKWDQWSELSVYRKLIQSDLFFILYFVMKVEIANHPFVVARCREVDEGPDSDTLDLWAREHFKSTILTQARIIQRLACDCNRRIGIFSYSKPAAIRFLRSIKNVLESSELIHACFPDIFYDNPKADAFKWSEDVGLYVKRTTFAKEPSVSAHGLLEGMPTGDHFTDLIYDDVETPDSVNSPEMLSKLKEMYNMSLNLGTIDGTKCVIGTTYHHEGLLEYLRTLKDSDGELVYNVRVHPATDNGQANGKAVLLSEKRLAELRINRKTFNSQQLLNPTPLSDAELNPDRLIELNPEDVPKELWKFMLIDQAGINESREGDAWGIHVVGVDPYTDDLGASDIYILDSSIEPLAHTAAMVRILDMYLRNGRILRIAVEKVGISTTEIHISNALRAKGKYLTVENKGITLVRPGGRKKEDRILENLAWPLQNGKIFISKGIAPAHRERLKLEMSKFPFWKDDGLDALSYIYDVIKEYRFGPRPPQDDSEEKYDVYYHRAKMRMDRIMNGGSVDGWLVV